jgi:hypothetical protein
MIKIYDVKKGEHVYVNPRYVTSVIPHGGTEWNKWSKLWIVGNAGYGTFEIYSNVTPKEIAELIEKQTERN